MVIRWDNNKNLTKCSFHILTNKYLKSIFKFSLNLKSIDSSQNDARNTVVLHLAQSPEKTQRLEGVEIAATGVRFPFWFWAIK